MCSKVEECLCGLGLWNEEGVGLGSYGISSALPVIDSLSNRLEFFWVVRLDLPCK